MTVHSSVKKAQRNLINLEKYLKGEKMEPDPSQWYPGMGQEKMAQTEIQKFLLNTRTTKTTKF